MAGEKKLIVLALLGSERSGKSSITNRYRDKPLAFDERYVPTSGIDFLNKGAPNELNTRRRLLDIPGKTGDQQLTQYITYQIDVVGIVLMYNNDGTLNLSGVQHYYELTKKKLGEVPIYFIVNKIDLNVQKLEREEVKMKIRVLLPLQANIGDSNFLFCSAKTGEGVDNVFKTMEDAAYFSSTPTPSFTDKNLPGNDIVKQWAVGDGLLLLAIAITLVVLAPVGGVLVAGPLSVLALAGIVSSAAFALWNAGCAAYYLWTKDEESPPPDGDGKPYNSDSNAQLLPRQPTTIYGNSPRTVNLDFKPSSDNDSPTNTCKKT